VTAAVVVVIAVLFAGTALVIRDSFRRAGRWGINVRRVTCPRCEQLLPRIRAPKNLSQSMWGGATCTCGCEVDKWGRETAP